MFQKPLNILLISRCPPYPLHLGDRLIPYHLARELKARGYQFDLLAFYNQPDDPQQVEHYAHLFNSVQLIREPVRSTLSYIHRLLNPTRQFPASCNGSWSSQMWDAIVQHLTTHKYDVVQLFGGVHVYEYRKLVQSYPNLIVPYESYSLYLQRLYAQQSSLLGKLVIWLQQLIAQHYERIMFRGYETVVVLSPVDRDMLQSLNPALQVEVIPNGVDTSYFTPTETQAEDATLLFVGNFDYVPNADAAHWLVSEIFPHIKQRLPHTRLLIVGNNPPDTLQCTADVEITGRVPDVRPYLERATLFVSPLRVGAGIKNKVLEAMAMARPVVATRLSCDGISLIEGTHVVYGETADELANAAVQLINDPKRRQAMSEANRQFIEQYYTWQRIAEQYEQLYHRLIRDHRYVER